VPSPMPSVRSVSTPTSLCRPGTISVPIATGGFICQPCPVNTFWMGKHHIHTHTYTQSHTHTNILTHTKQPLFHE
jgi:hypothetical protein